ncbi:GntR family transcriptional regulator [Roseospira marina]|uniref:GntR family transcriptional regulator n=1 Tax=Roseospira marina TaxID=140057 RepID=A0A5M6IE51_9PROT|nr:GntR family transcriptional regulator [Roseospira marina]KAA5606362.1 GntR family transcriptional regulator [Roseospira marina]MBB4314239.1 DNA-binding GntR family transcriptional regulator [Roseospira marina]MBB5087399.1 DNA-binding GntR family transcriptional regulator [Roseospira marina]
MSKLNPVSPPVSEDMTEDDVHRHIAEAIIDRRLPPGVKLVEQNLADIFSVSRARVRAALSRLALEKMVTVEPNRGARVATPSVEEARQVFDARFLVEDGIVRAAARAMDAAARARLEAHVQAEADARARRDRHAVIRLSGEFHLLLADIAGNGVLLDFLRELISRSSLVISVYERPGATDCSHHGHHDLLHHLIARNAEGAATAMRQHMEEIVESLDLSAHREDGVDLMRVFASLRRVDA